MVFDLDSFVIFADLYQETLRLHRQADDQSNRSHLSALDTAPYFDGGRRSVFYLWFYEEAIRDGHEVRWPLAASYVSRGVAELAGLGWVYEGTAELIGSASNAAQALVRRANQIIMDDVIGKLADLMARPKVTGRAAVEWDMSILIEEQFLAQPLYETADVDAVAQVGAAAQQGLLIRAGGWRPFGPNASEVTPGLGRRRGPMPAFTKSILSPADRWEYGMQLAAAISTIVPRDQQGEPVLIPSTPPKPRPEYLDGSRLKELDTRPRLHLYEAITDSRLNSAETMELDDVMSGFSEYEQRQFLDDPRFVQRLIDAGAAFGTFLAGMRGFGVDLERQLRALDRYPGRSWFIDVSYRPDIKPMVLRAQPAQRAVIRGAEWRAIFVDICDNATIVEATDDLGLDPAEAAEWIKAET